MAPETLPSFPALIFLIPDLTRNLKRGSTLPPNRSPARAVCALQVFRLGYKYYLYTKRFYGFAAHWADEMILVRLQFCIITGYFLLSGDSKR